MGNVATITKLGTFDPCLERFYTWLEGQGRFRDGLGYELMESTILWLGYAYIPSPPRESRL